MHWVKESMIVVTQKLRSRPHGEDSAAEMDAYIYVYINFH